MIIFVSLTKVTLGQSDAAYANCIFFKDNGHNVVLQQDEDCYSGQFSKDVNYYESIRYHEMGYSDIAGTQMMHLKK